MTTYWLIGDKRVGRKNAQNGNDDGAGPSTSFAGDNVNPSITFQGPDSPAGHSAQNGYTVDINNQEDDDEDDLQSQGACALPSNHTQRTNSSNEFVYAHGVEITDIPYQENPVHVPTKLSVELQNERTRIQREMNNSYLVNSPNDVVEDKGKEEDQQNSSPRDMGLEREHESNGDELFAITPYDSAGVVSKGKVRATVMMFNRRLQNDDNKKPN